MTVSLAVAQRNLALDAGLSPACDTGYLRIYSGVVPNNADTALSGNVLLAELRFGAISFGGAAAGGKVANAITAAAAAAATGTATFFRALKSDGVTVVMQGSVGIAGADLNLNTTSIVIGTPVQCTACTVTFPA
jgi:hypothetical protein